LRCALEILFPAHVEIAKIEMPLAGSFDLRFQTLKLCGTPMIFSFGRHRIDVERREVRHGEASVHVEPQVFDLLICLLENRDRVVSKDDLMNSVWGDRIVSESTLTSRINAVRKAIGDNGKNQRLIRTIPRKGFLFVGDVKTEENESAPATAVAGQVAANERASALMAERRSIAVLPFTNMSGDRNQEYFSDGISEDIISALSKLRWFLVIARNSSFLYKGKSVHIKQVAEELGVDYVVEGSVRNVANRVRISAQLNDVATASHVWAERYEGSLGDVFAVQDEITNSIVAAIEPQLYAAESFHAERKPPNSMDAWDLVMRAMSYYWRVTRQDNVVAQAFLEKAVAIDPNYGQALGLLATSHAFGAHMGWEDMTTAIPIAEGAARSAIQIDSEDPWAHNALGSVYLWKRRLEDSLAEFEVALQLNPNFSLAQGFYALVLTYSGRWQEADAAVRRALRLSPRGPFSAIYYGVAGYAQFTGRNYDEAIRMCREAVRERSDFTGAFRVISAAAGMLGNHELAVTSLQELRRTQPNISLAWIANQIPWNLDADRDHYLEGLRRAGLT
jgi:TolB-like protein/tetratricopeptide (TPR) repeat protein